MNLIIQVQADPIDFSQCFQNINLAISVFLFLFSLFIDECWSSFSHFCVYKGFGFSSQGSCQMLFHIRNYTDKLTAVRRDYILFGSQLCKYLSIYICLSVFIYFHTNVKLNGFLNPNISGFFIFREMG